MDGVGKVLTCVFAFCMALFLGVVFLGVPIARMDPEGFQRFMDTVRLFLTFAQSIAKMFSDISWPAAAVLIVSLLVGARAASNMRRRRTSTRRAP